MTRSPRRLKQQVQDTVGEQVRDLPLHAVRLAMFGVGRALLLSDRVTREYKEITEGGGVRPVLGRLRTDVQSTAGKVVGRVVERVRGEEPAPAPRPRPSGPSGPSGSSRPDASRTAPRHSAATPDGEISIGKPGAPPSDAGHTPKHARPASEPAKSEPKPEPAKPEAAKPEPAKPEPAKAEAAKPAKDDRAKDEPAAKDLPVPDYDEATLPQLRARLRGLSADQVRLLREYERRHAARTEVIRMYERRIAKLNGQN